MASLNCIADQLTQGSHTPYTDARQAFGSLGVCPFGYRCRFLDSHSENVGDGEGFRGCGLNLVYDYDRLRSVAPASLETDEERVRWAYETRGEFNFVPPARIRQVRGTKVEQLPITRSYLRSIGEPMDTRAQKNNNARGQGRGRFKGRNDKGNGDGRDEVASNGAGRWSSNL